MREDEIEEELKAFRAEVSAYKILPYPTLPYPNSFPLASFILFSFSSSMQP